MAMTRRRLPESGDLFKVDISYVDNEWQVKASIRRYGTKTFRPIRPFPTEFDEQLKYCAKFIPAPTLHVLMMIEIDKIQENYPTPFDIPGE